MRISFQNELLYPKKAFTDVGQLYSYFEQSGQQELPATCVHWFDFKTNQAHELSVCYPGEFYKMVLCIAGQSRSEPRTSQRYSFSTGQAHFYKTEQEPYNSALPAATAFKVIHLHLSESHVRLLQNEVPSLFERQFGKMRLYPECAASFVQLKTISKENPALLRLYEEKLITDQLFGLASHMLPKSGGRDILQEAIWHIHQAGRYLTISELAHMCGTNTFRLKQLFREQLHSSVFQYQSDLHLQRAAQLLLDTPASVAEVSQQCGYASAAAFSNAFERKYSVRPLAFKNSRSGR